MAGPLHNLIRIGRQVVVDAEVVSETILGPLRTEREALVGQFEDRRRRIEVFVGGTGGVGKGRRRALLEREIGAGLPSRSAGAPAGQVQTGLDRTLPGKEAS